MKYPSVIVMALNRGMRVDYIPMNDFAKLLAKTCGQKSLSKSQLVVWEEAGSKVTIKG